MSRRRAFVALLAAVLVCAHVGASADSLAPGEDGVAPSACANTDASGSCAWPDAPALGAAKDAGGPPPPACDADDTPADTGTADGKGAAAAGATQEATAEAVTKTTTAASTVDAAASAEPAGAAYAPDAPPMLTAPAPALEAGAEAAGPGAAPPTTAATDAIAEAEAGPDGPAAAAAAVAAADDALAELHTLLAAARQAVTALEAAVTAAERRLAAAAAAGGARPPLAGGGATDAAHVAALLRSLGAGGDAASAAARQALRAALAEVLSERTAVAAAAPVKAAPVAAPVAGGAAFDTAALLAAVAAAAGGTAEVGGGLADSDEWLGTHFALRSALAPPPPPPPADAAADGTAITVPPSPPAAITCAFPYELPYPNTAAHGGGALVYTLVGDAAGSLMILSPSGAVLHELHTGTHSPVTACTAYFVRRYESVVVTGHANGQTRSFAVVVAQPPPPPAEQGEGAARQRRRSRAAGGGGFTDAAVAAAVGIQSVTLHHVVESMPQAALPWAAVEEVEELLRKQHEAGLGGGYMPSAPAAAPAAAGSPAAAAGGSGGAQVPYTGPPAPIMHLLPYKLSNKATGRRHLVVIDRAGNIRLDRDNGTTRFFARTNRTQLAAHFVGTYVVMLSATHAAVMPTLQARMPRSYPCHHLNGSRVLAATFDAQRPFRAYGINGRGELLSVVTPHEGRLSACKVQRATPLPWLPAAHLSPAPPYTLSLAPMRGYLLLSHGPGGGRHVLFNVTGLSRGGVPSVAAVTGATLAAAAAPLAVAPAHDGPAAAATALAAASAAAAAPPGLPGPHGGLIGGLLPLPHVAAVGAGTQVVLLSVRSDSAEAAAAGAGSDGAGAADVAAAGGGGGGYGGGGVLLVVLGSRLPQAASPSAGMKSWTQPIFFGAMFVVGLYQFWRMTTTRAERREMAAMPSALRGLGGGGGRRRGRGYGSGAEYDMFDDSPGYYPYASGGGGGGGGAKGGGGRSVPRASLGAPLRSALRTNARPSRPAGRVTYEDEYGPGGGGSGGEDGYGYGNEE